MNREVTIAGSGPAGLAAAAACLERGLRVTVVAPEPRAPWVPTYCGFVGQLPDVPLDAVWPHVEVWLGSGEVVRLLRPYGRVDSRALQASLWERARAAHVVEGTLEELGPGTIDARGGRGATHFQTAYGLRATCTNGPQSACFMDFSQPFGDGTEPPSFLYALPLPDGTTLFEETCLARRPGLPLDLLEARLHERLVAKGVRLGPALQVERCRIPLDVPVPAATWPVRFGAAAGMVHPATGFLLGRVLAHAPVLAAALAEDSANAALPTWSALWSPDRLRRARLYRYGASALARLGAEDTRSFFRTFFSMPPSFVHAFLDDALTASALAHGMLRLFARLPLRVRWRLGKAGDPSELVRAAILWEES